MLHRLPVRPQFPEQLIAGEKEEEKLKEYKLKLAESGKFEEELKIKIEEMAKK